MQSCSAFGAKLIQLPVRYDGYVSTVTHKYKYMYKYVVYYSYPSSTLNLLKFSFGTSSGRLDNMTGYTL